MKLKPLQFITEDVNAPDKVLRPIADKLPLDPEGVQAYLQASLGYTEAQAKALANS